MAGIFWLAAEAVFGQSYTPDWESLDRRPVPEWFTDAKFGIFIHWGLYSVPAWAPADADIGIYAKYAEWYWWRIHEDSEAGALFRAHHDKTYGPGFPYQNFAPFFRAEHFDPEGWAELFRNAGARYVVLTSKHHEGFTLWPSAQSWNWNATDVGPHRDLCGDLTRAVKEAGLHMGFYYSLYEWYNPQYREKPADYVEEHMLPQMRDLVVRYQPDLLYADGEWDYPSDFWKSTRFLAWLFNESPVKNSICVNDRWGKETRGVHGGYYTTEYGMVHDQAGADISGHPWEECRGIGTSFGYNRTEDLDNYLSSDALVDLLVSKVAAGGNLLLDIGPTADGRIPVIMQQRLLDIGAWLKVNGEAIYGTRPWDTPIPDGADSTLFYTTKGKDLYVICTRWPQEPVVVPGIRGAGKVSLLGNSQPVKAKVRDGKLIIFPPTLNPAANPCDYAWVFSVQDARTP